MSRPDHNPAIYCECPDCRRSERAGGWLLAGFAVLIFATGVVAGIFAAGHFVFGVL